MNESHSNRYDMHTKHLTIQNLWIKFRNYTIAQTKFRYFHTQLYPLLFDGSFNLPFRILCVHEYDQRFEIFEEIPQKNFLLITKRFLSFGYFY